MKNITLYEINQDIAMLLDTVLPVDTETGEIIDEKAYDALNDLLLDRTEKIQNVALYIVSIIRFLEQVTGEIQKLTATKALLTKKLESIKLYLASQLDQGEKHSFPNVTVSWRKSTSVVVDPELNIDEYEKSYPENVRVKKEIDKTKIKASFEKTGILGWGVKIIEKLNLQIK